MPSTGAVSGPHGSRTSVRGAVSARYRESALSRREFQLAISLESKILAMSMGRSSSVKLSRSSRPGPALARNGACAIEATEAMSRRNWMSMGERPNSMSPTRNVYGDPPSVPYSDSYTCLKNTD